MSQSRIKALGLDNSLDFHRLEVRRKLWKIAVVIDKNDLNECSKENPFYADLGRELTELRNAILIWEQDDAKVRKELLDIVDDLKQMWDMDMSF